MKASVQPWNMGFCPQLVGTWQSNVLPCFSQTPTTSRKYFCLLAWNLKTRKNVATTNKMETQHWHFFLENVNCLSCVTQISLHFCKRSRSTLILQLRIPFHSLLANKWFFSNRKKLEFSELFSTTPYIYMYFFPLVEFFFN